MTAGTALAILMCVVFPIAVCVAFTPVAAWKIVWGAVAAWAVLFGAIFGAIYLLHGAVA